MRFGGTVMQEKHYLTQLKQMHRRERYQYEKETTYRVFYFGREEELYSYFPQAAYKAPFSSDETEYERMCRKALRMALQKFKEDNPEGYGYIAEYYLGDRISEAEMGRRHNMSRQAISQRLIKYIGQLRSIVFDYMDFLGA